MLIQKAYYTDIGRKQTNQDALIYLRGRLNNQEVCLAAVCDGMGGLSKGELASAHMIRALDGWFARTLPGIVNREDLSQEVEASWNELIGRQNDILVRYGKRMGMSLGTTIAAFLLVGDSYYIVNVGDSRVCMVTDGGVRILTRDQTLVMQEVERGNLRYEDMEKDPRRSILLQCVGANDAVFPDYYAGRIEEPAVILICSDGFRHLIGLEEMHRRLCPSLQVDELALTAAVAGIGKDVFARGEHDNVTAVAVSVR